MFFCVAGSGQMWRRSGDRDEIVTLQPGVALTIPREVAFQFRAAATVALEVVITTIPAWPGDAEAVFVDGIWAAQP